MRHILYKTLCMTLVLVFGLIFSVHSAYAVSVTVLSSKTEASLFDIVTDGTNLWTGSWSPSEGVTIQFAPLGGGMLNALPGVTSPCCVNGMTIIGNDIYWVDPNGDPDATAIFKTPKTGGSYTKVYSGFATGQPIVDGADLATDGTKLFSADFVNGRVHSMDPTTPVSNITQIGPERYGGYFSNEHFNGIVFGEGNLFVFDGGKAGVIDPGIYTHDAYNPSGSWNTLISGPMFDMGILGLVAYGDGILYVTHRDTIYSIPATGGPLTSITDPLFHNLRGITFNDGSLYVTDYYDIDPADGVYGNGTILRVDMEPIPEPATMLLLGSGLVGLAGVGRKKYKR